MKCTIRIYLQNDDFSQEYADERFNGEESELNRKYDWEDELAIKPEIDQMRMEVDSEVVLQGQLPNGQSFQEKVLNMRKFTFMDREGTPVAQVACSESLYAEHEESDQSGMELKLYLKDKIPFSNPIPGIYISAEHFPKSLILE